MKVPATFVHQIDSRANKNTTWIETCSSIFWSHHGDLLESGKCIWPAWSLQELVGLFRATIDSFWIEYPKEKMQKALQKNVRLCVCVIQTDEITQHEQFKNSSKFDVNITHKAMPNLQEITRVKSPHQSPPKKNTWPLQVSPFSPCLATKHHLPWCYSYRNLNSCMQSFMPKVFRYVEAVATEGQHQPTGTN